jgi:hypothetical protein
MLVTKIVKVATATLFALALACGTLLAQNRASDFFTVSHSPSVTPFTDSNNATVTLYSNLGPTTTNEYYDTNGYCVTGNNQSTCGTSEQWIATPFTPAKASHATQIQVALQYFSGTNEFQVSLYNDVGGAPGTSLKTVEGKNAPTAGTCCTLVNVSLGTPGVSLTAATQYWVVVSADDTHAPTFSAYWAFTNFANVAYNPAQAGWTTFQDNGAEAAAVKGTVP